MSLFRKKKDREQRVAHASKLLPENLPPQRCPVHGTRLEARKTYYVCEACRAEALNRRAAGRWYARRCRNFSCRTTFLTNAMQQVRCHRCTRRKYGEPFGRHAEKREYLPDL